MQPLLKPLSVDGEGLKGVVIFVTMYSMCFVNQDIVEVVVYGLGER